MKTAASSSAGRSTASAADWAVSSSCCAAALSRTGPGHRTRVRGAHLASCCSSRWSCLATVVVTVVRPAASCTAWNVTFAAAVAAVVAAAAAGGGGDAAPVSGWGCSRSAVAYTRA